MSLFSNKDDAYQAHVRNVHDRFAKYGLLHKVQLPFGARNADLMIVSIARANSRLLNDPDADGERFNDLCERNNLDKSKIRYSHLFWYPNQTIYNIKDQEIRDGYYDDLTTTLLDEIKIIKPKVVMTMGKVVHHLLPDVRLSTVNGNTHLLTIGEENYPVIPSMGVGYGDQHLPIMNRAFASASTIINGGGTL